MPGMKFRFSIRDLLWLTLVVAILVSWWLDHRHLMGVIHQDDDFTISGMQEVPVPLVPFPAPAK